MKNRPRRSRTDYTVIEAPLHGPLPTTSVCTQPPWAPPAVGVNTILNLRVTLADKGRGRPRVWLPHSKTAAGLAEGIITRIDPRSYKPDFEENASLFLPAPCSCVSSSCLSWPAHIALSLHSKLLTFPALIVPTTTSNHPVTETPTTRQRGSQRQTSRVSFLSEGLWLFPCSGHLPVLKTWFSESSRCWGS